MTFLPFLPFLPFLRLRRSAQKSNATALPVRHQAGSEVQQQLVAITDILYLFF